MNIGEIKTAIRSRGFETDTATAQLEAIRAIDRRIQGARRWPWNETSSTGTLAVGDSTEPYPATARDIDAVKIELGTEYDELEFVPYEQLRDVLHLDRTNGVPSYWSERGRTIYFSPRADRAYTLTIEHTAAPAVLDDDADVPTIPPEYHDLYVAGAVALLAQRERDWSLYTATSTEFADRYAEMVRAVGVRQRQSARHVVRSDFWTSINSYG